jgi:hypothetical protein
MDRSYTAADLRLILSGLSSRRPDGGWSSASRQKAVVLRLLLAPYLAADRSDVPGDRSLVEDGVNGILFDARSGKSLAVAVERVLALKPDQLRARGLAKKSCKGFSEEKVIRAYIEPLDH